VNHYCLYSVDLSAAFDLLKPDKFIDLFKNTLSEGLLFSLADFLSKRKFVVELNGERSKEIALDRGCVQGSILGPKLFSLYLFELERKLGQNCTVVSYADDTYVIVTGKDKTDTERKTKQILSKHVKYLRSIGMVVNESKTELMWIGKDNHSSSIVVNNKTLHFKQHMKALGIIIQKDLNWSMQAESAIKKGIKLISNFKFLRKYLTESQFLKAVSAHFYGTVFYACAVWYDNISSSLKTKFRSLHYRLLRSACRDYYFEYSRDYLARRCQRANPDEWSHFCSANLVLKTLSDKHPSRLHSLLRSSYFEEPRKGGLGKFLTNQKPRSANSQFKTD